MSQKRRQILQLYFDTEEKDKTASIRIPDPKDDLTSEEILATMEEIIEGDVFFSKNGDFVAPKSARIVETITEEFDIVVD